MDMSQHPAAEAATHSTAQSLPGEPHNRDMSNPGEIWAFALAIVVLAALAVGFVLGGLAVVGTIMVAVVPVIYVVLITISVGH
jgi:hypothetical protein